MVRPYIEIIQSILLKFALYTPSRPSKRIVSLQFPRETNDSTLNVIVNFPHYADNRIVTSRYTIFNFLPKAIFEQLQRLANFYFLLCGILQLFTDTPLPVYTSFMPLVSVLGIALIKQAYEDVQRHRADAVVNQRPVQRFSHRHGAFILTRAEDLRVGDLIACHANEEFPADLLLISCSESCYSLADTCNKVENVNHHHRHSSSYYVSSTECYVNTASLDGETYLKECLCLSMTQTWNKKWFCDTSGESSRIMDECEGGRIDMVQLEYEEPTRNVHEFSGNVAIHYYDMFHKESKKKVSPLSVKNVVMRGTRLQNTHHIIGCVLYTGCDTKMALNSHIPSMKFSRVERILNSYLVSYMLIMTLAAVVCAIAYFEVSISTPWYRQPILLSFWIFIQSVFGFIILYSYLIPVSLYVTVELQKFFSCFFLHWDKDMVKKGVGEDTLAASANTSDLIEELGQVQYLFSDKTGTLTQNEMVFHRCAVCIKSESNPRIIRIDNYLDLNGKLWAEKEFDICPAPIEKMNVDLEALLTAMALCHTVRDHITLGNTANKDNTPPTEKRNNFITTKWKKKLNVVEKNTMKPSSSLEYQASSPDEKAFVEACYKYGFVFTRESDHYILTNTRTGERQSYKVLRRLDFDSVRKRMSIVLEHRDGFSGQTICRLFCKGGDDSMQPLCNDSEAFAKLKVYVDEFGRQGLRTLVFGVKTLSYEEYHRLSSQLDEQEISGNETGKKEAIRAFESGLELLGCTGVEDTLQDNVAATIHSLREAGIKIWVLTGDKKETAEQISLSTKLFDNLDKKTTLELVNCNSTQKCEERILELLKQVARSKTDFKLIIDSGSLREALGATCSVLFQRLCVHRHLSSVLCCRMEPLQKAEVVNFMKQSVYPEPITAAIGDGANDVSMIQAAHVGIGIYGKEGRQAARAADYAIPEFRHLHKLLLVHGHLFYMRIVVLIQYFFYKNIVFVSAEFYFTIFSAFSSQSLYDPLYLMLYNMLFTSLPILVFGLVEQSIEIKYLKSKPKLYQTISGGSHLSWRYFLLWNILGLWHSLVVYFGVHLLLFFENNSSVFGSSGLSSGIPEMGTLVLACVWWVVNLKLMLTSHYLNYLYFIAILPITLGGNLIILLVYSETTIVAWILNQYDMIGAWFVLFSSPAAWFTMFLIISLSLLPDIVLRWIADANSMKQLHEKVFRFSIPTVDGMVTHRKTSASSQGNGEKTVKVGIDNPAYGDTFCSTISTYL